MATRSELKVLQKPKQQEKERDNRSFSILRRTPIHHNFDRFSSKFLYNFFLDY